MFRSVNVLEIGSLNLNGSARQFFTTGVKYNGVDQRGGEGVDIQSEAIEYLSTIKKPLFDVAISTECFEHAKEWRKILKEMFRVTKKSGLVIVTVANEHRPAHGWDGNALQKGDHYEAVKEGALMAAAGNHKPLIWELDNCHGDVRAAWIKS